MTGYEDGLSPVSQQLTDYGVEGAPLGPKLSAYPLHTQIWREAFLKRLADVGYEVLFEAVSHAWSLLNSPKHARCHSMAHSAGVEGTGKKALWNVLERCLDEYLRTDLICSPTSAQGIGLEALHDASMAAWMAETERECAVLTEFAAILGGERDIRLATRQSGRILKGPWLLTTRAADP